MENRKDVMYTDMAKKAAEKTEETKETEKAREQEEKDMSQNKTQNPDNGEMTRRELKSRRTGSTKTFENSDHSFTTEIYLSPVHYQAEDGSWEEMDDTLEAVETPAEAENEAENVQKETADTHGSFRAQVVALSGAVDETADAGSQPEKNTLNEKENAALSATAFVNRKGHWQASFAASADSESAITIRDGDHTVSWQVGTASGKALWQWPGQS